MCIHRYAHVYLCTCICICVRTHVCRLRICVHTICTRTYTYTLFEAQTNVWKRFFQFILNAPIFGCRQKRIGNKMLHLKTWKEAKNVLAQDNSMYLMKSYSKNNVSSAVSRAAHMCHVDYHVLVDWAQGHRNHDQIQWLSVVRFGV